MAAKQELGDLQLVLTEPASRKAQQLLGLRCGALKQLLQDERTRVASENTVFFAILEWYAHQQQIAAKCSQQQQRQRSEQLESLQGVLHRLAYRKRARGAPAPLPASASLPAAFASQDYAALKDCAAFERLGSLLHGEAPAPELPRAAPSPVVVWCWLFSHTATLAPVIVSRIL